MDTRLLRPWLEAGFLEKHAWFATTKGTPQGGIISPALANWTLDGLQRLLTDRFANTPQQRKNKVHLVRYADDFLITGISKELLRDQVQPLVAHFLKERGLESPTRKPRSRMWNTASTSWDRTYDAIVAARSDQAVSTIRQNVLDQDPGNDPELGQPDGR